VIGEEKFLPEMSDCVASKFGSERLAGRGGCEWTGTECAGQAADASTTHREDTEAQRGEAPTELITAEHAEYAKRPAGGFGIARTSRIPRSVLVWNIFAASEQSRLLQHRERGGCFENSPRKHRGTEGICRC
jgi:hypothetical protein